MTSKRAFDIAASLPLAVAAALPVTAIAFTMAAVNRAAPFFGQKRIGKDGEIFTMWKIRSMNDARDPDTGKFLPDEQRTKWLGEMLRKFKIDELPQLIHVLKGEMSLVGPRPVSIYHEPFASDKKRRTVLPGLMGPAQLISKTGMTDEKCLALDHDYIDRQSFLHDLKIIMRTLPSIIANRNNGHYYAGGQESSQP